METARRALQDLRLQRAIRRVSDRLREEPKADRSRLVSEAALTYGLSPAQEEFLYHMYGRAA
ncbi:MAG: hypothetical protein ACE147_17745 [Candidatus Methylomirabilales bacterium]